MLHIVTQCTDRKKLPVAHELRLRRFREKDLTRRAQSWIKALECVSPVVAVRSLYAGEHWVTSLELESMAAAKGFTTRLWVVSAGLGFVAADAKAPAYSATFASNVADTVVVRDVASAEQRRDWLQCLRSRATGPTLVELAAENPRSFFLCVLSRPYVQAVLPDLLRVREQLADPDRLLLVTGKAPEIALGDLAGSWVPSSSRFRHIIGGTRIGQHARVAKTLLSELPSERFRASSWRRRANHWLKGAPQVEAYDRTPMSDLEVRLFARLSTSSSWSRALRDLRASGRACEQKRFRRIFKEEQVS